MELVKDVAAVLGVILSLASVIALFTKGGRKIIYLFIRKHTKDLYEVNEQQDASIQEIKNTLNDVNTKLNDLTKSHNSICEVLKDQCRESIKTTYYRYCEKKVIPLYERKAADSTYKIYTNMFHGNSWARFLYEEITKWEVDSKEIFK